MHYTVNWNHTLVATMALMTAMTKVEVMGKQMALSMVPQRE
jgi:hypothetical protein